jgi:DNA polymerase-3 subunit delta'
MNNTNANNFLVNEEVNNYLEKLSINKTLANGYIFFGAEGIGKKQTAIKFISKVFKKYSYSDSFKEKIKNNNHPDFLIIEPTSVIKSTKKDNLNTETSKKNNLGIIKIDQIRNIKNFLSQKSIDSQKKVVLIIDAHLLNESASNCLLKTLEEPNNGIFILTTSKLNLILDTIQSRCQLVRFKSFSKNQIKTFLKNSNNFDNSDIYQKLDFQDLVNSANGSPEKLIQSIEIWNGFTMEIKEKIDYPLKGNIDILEFSKLVSEQLEISQQICLVNLIQPLWWRKTKNPDLVRKLETLKSYLNKNIQPRLAWEVTLFKIAMENL